MTSTTTPPAVARAKPAHVGQGRISRWLVPSFFDLILLSVPAWLFFSGGAGFSRLLLDGDTGWHIRVGEWILEHRQIPQVDFLSFTMPGQPWFAWEWLAELIYGLLMQTWGLKGVLWISALLFMAFAGILLRNLTWRGAHLFVALPLTMLATSVGTMHLLARPHLFTLVFLPIFLWMAQADLRRPSRWIWTLVPLTVLWTNLHGGWLGGVASLGILAAGLAIEAWLGQRSWFAARRFALLAAACFAASIVNPFTWKLHVHVFGYMGNDWIKEVVQEFQSPTFRGENMLQFEILLFGGILASALLLRRRRVAEPLLILFWAHQSLVSARHALLFAIVVLPVLADLLMEAWNAWTRSAHRKSIPGILNSLAWDCQPALRRTSLSVAVIVLGVLAPFVPAPWPDNFPTEKFPVAIAEQYRDLLVSKRTFTNDDWADFLLFANYPGQRVFFDGRSDFYGEKLGNDYLKLIKGSFEWQEIIDRHQIEVVLVSPQTGLSSVLKLHPDWTVLEDNGLEILFERRPGSSKRLQSALMKSPVPAE
ncbi:MAG: hypothetical protein KJZ79_04470 [Bryobacteraceae bacterium]|nr:hypothetical protein [Bryobacteraceae bacterium]